MKFQLLNLEDGDLLRNLSIITFLKRENVISRNRRLNFISLDNNKRLLFGKNNKNTLIKFVKKIRSFNQFQDQIKITVTSDFKIGDFASSFEQFCKQLDEKDLRQLEIDQTQ